MRNERRHDTSFARNASEPISNARTASERLLKQNSFDHVPAGVIGASIGQIGTALARQSLRNVLSFCDARQMTAPEAYIQRSPEVFRDDG